mgnify:CR=1 FL=1|jgi:hypothetical protein
MCCFLMMMTWRCLSVRTYFVDDDGDVGDLSNIYYTPVRVRVYKTVLY